MIQRKGKLFIIAERAVRVLLWLRTS